LKLVSSTKTKQENKNHILNKSTKIELNNQLPKNFYGITTLLYLNLFPQARGAYEYEIIFGKAQIIHYGKAVRLRMKKKKCNISFDLQYIMLYITIKIKNRDTSYFLLWYSDLKEINNY